ncbi:hypothetical protein P692DRAFT_201197055 [Suillus brevipes Sb2]|nr:hypothetical protein P692DRAFT_201197055 [Suillus brevipes Sb2]
MTCISMEHVFLAQSMIYFWTTIPASIVLNSLQQCGNTRAACLNPQLLLSLSPEIYPQSPYLYPHLPLPLIQPATQSILDPRHFALSHYHVWQLRKPMHQT